MTWGPCPRLSVLLSLCWWYDLDPLMSYCVNQCWVESDDMTLTHWCPPVSISVGFHIWFQCEITLRWKSFTYIIRSLFHYLFVFSCFNGHLFPIYSIYNCHKDWWFLMNFIKRNWTLALILSVSLEIMAE